MPTGGTDTLTVSTTSDTQTSSPGSFPIATAQSVSQPTAIVSNLTAGAQANYIVLFTTSSTGGMSGKANSQITITLPGNTSVRTATNSSITVNGGSSLGSCGIGPTNNVAVCFLGSTATIAANTTVTVELDGVTNPSSVSTSSTLSVQTTSDTQSATSSGYQQGGTPSVTAITPSSGPTSGGTAVTITGTNFITGSSTVKFGSTAASNVTVVSPTSITAASPAGTGTVDVTVTTPGGTSATSAADHFTYAGTPTVTSISPTAGPTAGGNTVTINGTNLTGATAVHFGSAAATNVAVVSAAQVTATAPAGTAGTADVTVTTPGGTSATSANDHYVYTNGPTVTAVAPTAGPLAGAISVTITGTGFTGATAVTFGATAATGFTVNSSTQITATAPAESAGTVDITVTTPGGTSPATNADRYTFAAAPTVTGVNPTAGPITGATSVTITGTNLTNASAVKFGATGAISFTVNGATQITALAPAESAGTVDITVTTPGGTSATSAADHFMYDPPPTVSAVNPAIGPPGGGLTVTVTGTGFIPNATTVTFGSTAASNVIVAAGGTSLSAISPPGAGGVDVRVSTPGGTSATGVADRFIYGPPTVTNVSPSSGPTAGGTTVTITGTDFAANATSVRFGANTGSNVVVSSATSLTVIAPPGTGAVDVTVTTPAGTSATGPADQFTYAAATPMVTGISPSSGPTAGGTGVTINGTNFASGADVSFGSSPATNVVVVSSTQITATSPPGSGTVDVTVTTAGGTSATDAADRFTYNAPPAPPQASTPPVVSGGAPTTQTSNGSAVAGSVNPENLATTAFFQYGLDLSQRGPGASTTLYDQSTPPQTIGSDSSNHAISAPLTGLVPGGLYHVRLVATNPAGTTFGQDQTFTVAQAAPPPPPVLGQSQDVKPVSGTVFIRTASGQFIPLTGATQIPSGTVIDALHGTLAITTALPGGSGGAHDAAAKGKKPSGKAKTQSGTFGGAIFKLTQARTGLTNLSLVESAFQGAPSYATCKAHKAGEASAAAVSSKTLQLLHASAHGKFTTTGRYSAATVRGTIWTIADRCDGTLTHDVTDSVAVTDFVRHKTIVLHAGQSYLAPIRRRP